MTKSDSQLNGVDLGAVREITERFRADPPAGQTTFGAQVAWLGGFRTQAALGPVEGVRGDEPESLAGSGTGPAPEEVLLSAVGQCLIVGIAGSASARGIRIDGLTVRSEGVVNLSAAYGVDDRESSHAGFDEIHVTVELDADADRDELEALVQKAVSQAPIPNTVARAVPVITNLA
jgi:uncharacterized OsmC-like protein